MSRQLHDQQLRIRMTADEVAMADAIAEHDGDTRSTAIRRLIRDRYRKLFGDQPTGKRRR